MRTRIVIRCTTFTQLPAGVLRRQERELLRRSRADALDDTFCVILATLMQALDTTIANVAMFHQQIGREAMRQQSRFGASEYFERPMPLGAQRHGAVPGAAQPRRLLAPVRPGVGTDDAAPGDTHARPKRWHRT
jgi:hypothetical protein